MGAADLQALFSGSLFIRGTEGYEEARVGRVFNQRRPDRYPEAVLFPKDVDDIVAGVRLASERGWQVAVRSGGHSWAAWSVRDETLLMDLSRIQELGFDPVTGIATATPAVKGGLVLAPFLAANGRFFGGGHCPPVGIGGFLLQGGQGYNARGWGWAAENVVAIDAVTAEGRVVRADAQQNSDLYWAARGAGPSFPAIVTRFHLQTRPAPAYVAETVHFYGLSEFDTVMSWLHHAHRTISPDVELVALVHTPPEPIPGHEDHEGMVLGVTAVALVDSADAAVQALEPLTRCPVIDRAIMRVDAVPVSFDTLRARQIAANPEGHRYRVDCAWLDGPAEELVPAMRRLYCGLPTPQSFTIWFSMAPLRELPDMAFSLQSEIYCASYVVSTDPEHDDDLRAWLRGAMAEVEPFTIGQYLGDSDLTNRQVHFMADQNFARLQKVRADWDPTNLFVTYLATNESPLNKNHWEA